jgi:hypothetical protein
MRVDLLARLEFVLCTAIRAFSVARFANIEKGARVAVPQLHAGLLARAENTALRVEIGNDELNSAFHGFNNPKPWLTNAHISDCGR